MKIVRHGEVYGPGEEPPEPGKREPIFGLGLWPFIVTIAIVVLYVVSGLGDFFASAGREAVRLMLNLFR